MSINIEEPATEWMKGMWQTHTMEYNSAFVRKVIQTLAATGMNLEDIFLSEMNQSQENKYV